MSARKEFFFTEVKDKTPAPSALKKFLELLQTFEGAVMCTLQKKRKTRTLSQNAYYHGVIVNSYIQGVEKEWGEKMSHPQAHEDLKRECNWYEKVNERTGEVKRFVKSTTEHSTIEQVEYHERCRRTIQTFFGIYVPLPNEQGEFDYE